MVNGKLSIFTIYHFAFINKISVYHFAFKIKILKFFGLHVTQ